MLAKFSLISSPLVVIFVFGEIDFENFSVCQFQNSVIESNTVYKINTFFENCQNESDFRNSDFRKSNNTVVCFDISSVTKSSENSGKVPVSARRN